MLNCNSKNVLVAVKVRVMGERLDEAIKDKKHDLVTESQRQALKGGRPLLSSAYLNADS